MDVSQFLDIVITVPEGYFCLATRVDGIWNEEFYEWPTQKDLILEKAIESRAVGDVYFSSYLFSERSSKKSNVILDGHFTIQSDLDNADPTLLQFAPTILVQTSENRYQSYWKLSEAHYDIEALSRKLTYSIQDSDRSGWSLGHKMRLPDTLNYKYGDEGQPVFVIASKSHLYQPAELDVLPEVKREVAVIDIKFLKIDSIPDLIIGPNELLETIKNKIPLRVYNQYNVLAKDRSSALWALMCSAFRAGLDRESVLYLSAHSANNKWVNKPRELAKDVLRAEVVAFDLTNDAREIVNNARKTPGTYGEKSRVVLGAVQTLMTQMGSFIRTDKGAMFVHKLTGKPILLDRGSENLQTYLGSVFGLNPTEKEHQFVSAGLTVYARSITSLTDTASVSFYDQRSETMLLHTGQKDVLKVTSSGLEIVPNGIGVVFPWINEADAFYPVDSKIDWGKIMFSMSNTIDMTADQFTAVMKSWFLFILFRHASSARPLLALLGQPGSGKTTTAKKIYSLLYGQRKKIHALSDQDDFDNAVSNLPFVFYDNVDSYIPWLADRLAQSAGAIDVDKRKLYTNNDPYTVKRDAMVALTSHNPRFVRPDVVDRLVLINLSRYSDFVAENTLTYEVIKYRNLIWGAIVNDIQLILKTPRLLEPTVKMRISDFSAMGEWFAIALGYRQEFIDAMKSIKSAQKTTDIEEDQILATTLINYSERSKHANEFRLPGSIWVELMSYTDDPGTFNRLYKNAGVLGKKLWTLQDALKEIVDIEWLQGPIRTWRIRSLIQPS